MRLEADFIDIIKDFDRVYIFGVSSVAKRIYDLLGEYGKNIIIEGFIVSHKNENDVLFQEEKIFEITEVDSLNTPILVSVSKVYHPEVFQALDKQGFSNVIEAHRFFNMPIRNKSVFANFEKCKDLSVSGSCESEKIIHTQNTLKRMLHEYNQAFGGNQFYQSFEKIGIAGNRPSEYRIKKYGLRDFLLPSSRVLDIGCNTGFLDLSLSEACAEILGIEYNNTLVDIGKCAAAGLGIKNVRFECDDYKAWYRKNGEEKFDVIFSFAVHIWLNISPDEYAKEIYELLDANGYFIFESQDMAHDKGYELFCREFSHIGLTKVREDSMKDDGQIERHFSVFRKER